MFFYRTTAIAHVPVAAVPETGAVARMTRCMSLDQARENVRVNAACPGEVHTRMVDEMLREAGSTAEAPAAGVPMRCLAKPGDVANCVLFPASDPSACVTGTNFPVDGGNDATGGGEERTPGT